MSMDLRELPPRTGRAVPRAILAAGAAAVAATYFIDPNTTRIPLCPLHAVTGLWCPMCGATRATHALLHGDVVTALHDNAFYVLTLPLLLVAVWRWYDGWTRPGRPVLARPVLFAFLAVGLVFTLVRNLPVGHLLIPPT